MRRHRHIPLSDPFTHSHFLPPNRNIPSIGSSLAKAILIPFLFLVSGPAISSDSLVWLPYPDDGITLGQGFDILRNQKTPAVCVDYVPVEDAGLETSYDTSTLNSFTDVFSSLDIRSSGALDMSIFRASSKLQFANKIKTTSIGERFMFNANILRGVLYASPQKSFKRGAKNPASQKPNAIDEPPPPHVAFRQDLDGIADFDFSTQCGHGFVSAIVTGIELNAAITTHKKTSEDSAKLSGSLKVEALEGLIKGSGSIDGRSETVKSLETSQLNSFILGGEQYSLPTTIEKLREFVVRLPTLADRHPRPVRIAISPYSALTTGGDFSVFHNASTLRPLIYSYFAAREARDRIASILEDLETDSQDKSIFIHDEIELFRETHSINQVMLELQEILSTCRSVLSEGNSERSAQVDRESMQDVGQIFRTLEQGSRNLPMDKPQIFYRIFGGSPPGGTADDERELDVQKCVSGNRAQEGIQQALEGYFFSLASVPIDLTSIEDSQISKEEFRTSIEILAKSDIDEVLLAADRLRSAHLANWAHCTGNIRTRVDSLRLLGVSPTNLQVVLEENGGLIRNCQGEFEKRWEEFRTRVESIADQEKDSLLSAMATVREVLAREVYRKTIYPILESMCRTDIQYSLCAYSYEDAMFAVNKYIDLEREDVLEMAEILSIDFGDSSSNKVPPSKPPVFRGPGCKLDPGERACK